jgi:hypothetical protein
MFDQPDDAINDVARNEMGFDRYPGHVRLGLCRFDDGGEAMVRFVLFLGDLVDARREPRQLLDRHHVKLR